MRILKLLAVAIVGAVIGNPLPALADGPTQRGSSPLTGDAFACGGEIYTFVSGTLNFSVHQGESNSGNTSFTITLTPSDAMIESEDGDELMIRGATWFGDTFNAQQETQQFSQTVKLQMVQVGKGTQQNVNITVHFTSVNGNFKAFDFGSCS